MNSTTKQNHHSSDSNPERSDLPSITPGPWEAKNGAVMCPDLNKYGNWIVAACDRERTEEDEANLVLLAAAPDLFDACYNAKAMLDSAIGTGSRSDINKARAFLGAALAKAQRGSND